MGIKRYIYIYIYMMRMYSFHSAALMLCLIVCYFTNSVTCRTNNGCLPFMSNNKCSNILSLRGGEVLDVKTLEEVESIMLRASMENKIIVIDFSAKWCGPCKMIAPLYEELSNDASLQDKVIFLKVDVDDNRDTAAKYNISAMPTFIFIQKGDVIEKLMGANFPKLEAIVKELAS